MTLDFSKINKKIKLDEIIEISTCHNILKDYYKEHKEPVYIFLLDDDNKFYNLKNYSIIEGYKVKIDYKNGIIYYALDC